VPPLWEPGIAKFTGGYVVSDPELGSLIAEQRRTPEGPKRKELFAKICNGVDRSAEMIPLVSKPVTVGYRADRIKATIQPKEGYNDTLRHIATFERV
jgi:hypothetical protein